jgi:hypothetical protein
MRGEHIWIVVGAVIAALGIVFQILADEAEQTYIVCETSVPHVACAMPAFGFFLLIFVIPFAGGLGAMIYGIRKLGESARAARGARPPPT